jgi:hypothetical protein
MNVYPYNQSLVHTRGLNHHILQACGMIVYLHATTWYDGTREITMLSPLFYQNLLFSPPLRDALVWSGLPEDVVV